MVADACFVYSLSFFYKGPSDFGPGQCLADTKTDYIRKCVRIDLFAIAVVQNRLILQQPAI